MTKVAVMGMYFKTLEAAQKALPERENKYKRKQVIIRFENGYMIVAKAQLDRIREETIN